MESVSFDRFVCDYSGEKGLVEILFVYILKQIPDPRSRGVDCKSTPAALNNMNAYPVEQGIENF
jgi:hypothetical protein